MVRAIGLKEGYEFGLHKQLIRANGTRDEWRKRIFPRRMTKWIKVRARTEWRKKKCVESPFPERIHYLKAAAEQWYGVGGNDLWAVFDDDVELQSFLESLSLISKRNLRQVRNTIFRKRDHRWITKWVQEDGDDYSWAKAKAIYLLALLDRLCEGGLLVKGVKRRNLVDWSQLREW